MIKLSKNDFGEVGLKHQCMSVWSDIISVMMLELFQIREFKNWKSVQYLGHDFYCLILSCLDFSWNKITQCLLYELLMRLRNNCLLKNPSTESVLFLGNCQHWKPLVLLSRDGIYFIYVLKWCLLSNSALCGTKARYKALVSSSLTGSISSAISLSFLTKSSWSDWAMFGVKGCGLATKMETCSIALQSR